jgi:hypothetical protein
MRAKTSYQRGRKVKTNQQDRKPRLVCKTSIRGFESHPRLHVLPVRSGEILLRKFAAPTIGSGDDASFECDLVTEPFETLDVVTGQALRFETVEEIAAQVGVVRSCSHHVIENDQY